MSLTTGVDNFTGTSANENFSANRSVGTNNGLLETLENADVIDGGAGTDTLTAQFVTAGVNVTPTIRNIETLSLEAQAAATLNMVNSDASVKTVSTANNAAALEVTNLQGKVDSFNVTNTANNVTVSMNAGLTGSSDSATVTLSNVTAAAAISIGNNSANGGNGYETIALVSNGTVANSITLDDTANANAAGSLATISISGANNLTLASNANMTTVTTVDASAYTGNLTYTAAAANGQAMTVTGGSGNDIINVNGFAATDTINGGAGTDRLVLTNAEATAATAARTNVTNVEWVRLSNTTDGTAISTNNLGGASMTGVQLGSAVNHTGDVVVNFAAGTANFDRQDSTDSANETTTVTIAGVATTDTLNVTLGTATAGSTWNGTGAFTITGAETVNIATQGGAATIGGALTLTNTAASEAIVVTGSQSLTITGVTTADSINASGMTGTASLTMTGGSAAQSIAITGTGNADTLVGGTAADIIAGGAGNDTIRNAVSGANSAANDILTGGAGNDTFQLVGSVAATATNYNGVLFISDFTVGSTLTSTDVISIDVTNATYGTSKIAQGATDVALTATAAGSTVIQTVV